MQTINRILRVTGCAGTWCGELGKTAELPEIILGVCPVLRFDLRSSDKDKVSGALLPLPPDDVRSDAYCLVLDADYDQETPPKLLVSTDIALLATEDRTYIDARLPNTAIPALIQVLAKQKTVTLHGELAGYSKSNQNAGPADFAIQFELTVRNRVHLPGSEVPPEVVENPDYLTRVQILALIEAMTRPDPGPPGKSAYEVAVAAGFKGTADEWLASLVGKEGKSGKSAYELALSAGFQGTLSDWLTSLRGPAGLTAYDLAVLDGYEGTQEEWLNSLHGRDGQDLHFDATGELDELEVYADEPQGFTFGAAVTDAKNKTTKLYIYVKRSDDYNDWCNPTVITYYERYAEIKALAPVEFKAPESGNAGYFSFDLSRYPYATVASVCIDTNEGELTLPYDSALGIRKVIKTKKNQLLIYFGKQCPAYESGRIYLTQFLGVADSAAPDIPEATVCYGYIADGITWRVADITADMLTAETVVSGPLPTGKIAIEAPAGAVVFALVPAGCIVTKDDGLGGKTAFETDNGAAGSGANGVALTLDGVEYRAFGEFNLLDGETFIYFDQEV